MMKACPYCGDTFHSRNIAVHLRLCVLGPGKMEQLRRELDDGTGRIVQRRAYERETQKRIASAVWLQKRFGSWDGLADALGLESSSLRGLNAPLTDAERHCCKRRAAVERARYPSK